jgi:hypothetical protein
VDWPRASLRKMSYDEICMFMFTPTVEVRLAKEGNDVNQVYTCIEQ